MSSNSFLYNRRLFQQDADLHPNDATNAPLSIADVAAALGDLACRFDIDVVERCDSSNALLLQRAAAGAPSGSVLVAREQTAGRGRRGRSWLSAPGDSLTFSLLWRYSAATSLAGLSLAVGVALARALEQLPLAGLSLKWPNDLLLGEGKLAGVLIEVVPSDAQAVVIGIGLNLRLPAEMPAELCARSAALATALTPLPAVSDLLARLLVQLHGVLTSFAADGFARLRPEWLRRHAHEQRPVQLISDFAAPLTGVCRGVDQDGALLLETQAGLQRIISGEISLRDAVTCAVPRVLQ